MHNLTKYSLASACKPLDYLLEKTINASSTENCKKCFPLQFQDLTDKKFKDTERDKTQTPAYKRPPEHLKTESCRLVPAGSRSALTIQIESHVRERLDEMMKAAECTIEKRLEKVASELAQKNTELVNTWAEFVHLSQEKRQVLARERALSRQMDTAVHLSAQGSSLPSLIERKEQ
ncbi:protein ZNF365-like [Acipenser ruthenus]|uniref:protein ZNF365-like n=1 Tax=Acipenser ruthenus TaxID=7906 RepID=UPI0027418793|nr:protein ZNF365-like [Acipenser ruthenus]